MRAEIIAVGTELLLGQIANTNAQFLSQKLADIGVGVYFHTVVGDNMERLLQVIRLAASRSDLVIFTGGLGPTQDDLTKESVAQHVGVGLETNLEAMKRIEDFFLQRGIVMTENNRKQALVLAGSHVFSNDFGMAPGMAIRHDSSTFVLLPGPPSELYPMVERHVMPYLIGLLPQKQVFHSHVLRFYGIGESALEEHLLDLIEKQDNPTIAPYAKEFEVTLRITARASSTEEGEALILPVEKEIRDRVGQYVYGMGEDSSLHDVLVTELGQRGETIACAESCTGGTLASLITSVSGSSAVFGGGIVCYTNEVKHQVLGVPEEVLHTVGAISEETAKLLAENVRVKLGTTYGVSVTGVAGPDPSEGKPVGLVYVGIAAEGKPTVVKELRLAGRRHAIVGRAAKFALFYALQMQKER
ncbi:competence/damage-inducible protein A [Brevibacillus reuszeri]|uniref:Putative competence-damage inducible protein n=1 Tax=Brevibacillus reuszeri TaxID=54915 RepID=A0A0K9YVS2_9BACL|nr:competence/damage-inducible protein A [Brevibacillus reuszeri]KNB72804.1 damage-inducible protein CinA [Brevibacillus reuszeri]MED1860489.1 competence/damage-inducible protein A [Brevibacillus reuszeri]